MTTYNLNNISFLIASFKDIVASFGKNSNSVKFYKRQIEGLCNIGQLDSYDVELVMRLLGMENTDSVKWDITEKKLEQYTATINEVMGYDTDTAKMFIIENLDRQGKITLAVKELVYETLGLDVKDLQKSLEKQSNKNNKQFGSYNNNTVNLDKDDKQFEKIIKMYSNLIIKVKNLDAVCSSDTRFYKCKIGELTSCRYIIKQLAKGSTFEIGTEQTTGDPCHPTHYIKSDHQAEECFKKIDWKKIYEKHSK